MFVKTMPVGELMTNSYLIADETTKEGFIIDPGDNGNYICSVIEEEGIKLLGILLTHAHFDHVGGLNEVKSKFNVPLYVNNKDEKICEMGVDKFGRIGYSPLYGPIPKADYNINEGDIIKMGNLNITVIETPGHTPGGVCFLVDKKLFSGDTVFQASIGRTDFYAGDSEALVNSVKNKVLTLDNDIQIFPGHGPSTTVAYERRNNPVAMGWY